MTFKETGERFISRIRTTDNRPQIFFREKMQVEKIDFLTRMLRVCELKFEPMAVIPAILAQKQYHSIHPPPTRSWDIAKVNMRHISPTIPGPPGWGGGVDYKVLVH